MVRFFEHCKLNGESKFSYKEMSTWADVEVELCMLHSRVCKFLMDTGLAEFARDCSYVFKEDYGHEVKIVMIKFIETDEYRLYIDGILKLYVNSSMSTDSIKDEIKDTRIKMGL